MIKLNKLLIWCFLWASCGLMGCGGGSHGSYDLQGDTLALNYATNLTMVDYGDFMTADFRNPWDTTRLMQRLVLVPRDKDIPANLPSGTVVRVPLTQSIVYPSVHNNLIAELGAIDAIRGVCDATYIYNPALRERIDSGIIEDCGTSMAPNIEKILLLSPDAILLSAYENSNDHNKVDQIGIPIIDCIDYMESSPLGRAEWMRFFGRLYGEGETADSLFAVTEKAYNDIKAKVAKVEYRPKVMTDLIYGQTWNVPAALSTTGVLISDAGATNTCEDVRRSGSVQLAPEEMLYRAHDADIWLIRYSQEKPLTLKQLASDNQIYTKFAPYGTGKVYGCNTRYSTFFEESGFHPDWVLAEYVGLFHPEVEGDDGRRYFSVVTSE